MKMANWKEDKQIKSATQVYQIYELDGLNKVDVKTVDGKVTIGVLLNGEWYIGVEGSNYNVDDVKKLVENQDITTISQMFAKQY